MPMAGALRTRFLKDDFGVEILDVDLNEASDETFGEIADIYRRNSVLLIRNQNLSPDTLLRFSSCFGPLVPHTRDEYTLPGYPTIYVLSNKVVNGKPIGIHRDGIGWHTDGSYLQRPLITTLLYALETPPEGGDTRFADTCGAYEALDEEDKRKYGELEVLHSFTYLMENREYGRAAVTPEQKAKTPEAVHPLVLTRPHDGKKSLYLSLGTAQEVVGYEPEEGREIVRRLADFATQPEFVYAHKWKAGDLVAWNNLCTLHCASLYDDTKYERLVYRVWID